MVAYTSWPLTVNGHLGEAFAHWWNTGDHLQEIVSFKTWGSADYYNIWFPAEVISRVQEVIKGPEPRIFHANLEFDPWLF